MAFKWEKMMESGEVGSSNELGVRVHKDGSYVARILRLAMLPPGIVQMALAGDDPEGLSLRKLANELPMLSDK
jgi:ParB-like chromosome segregation protein Spo0J